MTKAEIEKTKAEIERMDVRDFLPMARKEARAESRKDWDDVIAMVNRRKEHVQSRISQ